jgi:hypothetical protein
VATLTATPDSALARVLLEVDWPAPPTVSTVTISRVNGDGSTEVVRSANPATLVAGQWLDYDYDPGLDEVISYVATSTDAPGVVVESAQITVPSNGQTWLKHPGKPSLNRVVQVTRPPDVTRPIDLGVFPVLGRRRPIAVSSTRRSVSGTLELSSATLDERDGLLNLFADGAVLLFTAPGDYGVGRLFLAVGDVEEQRPAGAAPNPTRLWQVPFTAVGAPVGGVLASGNSYSDVLGAYTSYSDLLETEGTYEALLAGVGPSEPGAP